MDYIKPARIFFAAVFFSFLFLGSLFAQEQNGNVYGTRRLGLFIGANYGGPDEDMLRYAQSDAEAVSKVFRDMGGIAQEDIYLLVDPVTRRLEEYLDAIDRELIISRNSFRRTELVFYYAGHSDGEALFLRGDRYSWLTLRERINRMEADLRILFLDSCQSGAAIRERGGTKGQGFLHETSVPVEGRAIITATTEYQASRELDVIRSTYFTHSLVTGLRGAADTKGDGTVTLNELYNFVYDEIRTKTSAQQPMLDKNITGSEDMVLTSTKEARASFLIEGDIIGRIIIRDASDLRVAEFSKPGHRTVELALESGRYHFSLQRGTGSYWAARTLGEVGHIRLTMGDFQPSPEEGRRRGDGSDEAQENSPAPFAQGIYFDLGLDIGGKIHGYNMTDILKTAGMSGRDSLFDLGVGFRAGYGFFDNVPLFFVGELGLTEYINWGDSYYMLSGFAFMGPGVVYYLNPQIQLGLSIGYSHPLVLSDVSAININDKRGGFAWNTSVAYNIKSESNHGWLIGAKLLNANNTLKMSNGDKVILSGSQNIFLLGIFVKYVFKF